MLEGDGFLWLAGSVAGDGCHQSKEASPPQPPSLFANNGLGEELRAGEIWDVLGCVTSGTDPAPCQLPAALVLPRG